MVVYLRLVMHIFVMRNGCCAVQEGMVLASIAREDQQRLRFYGYLLALLAHTIWGSYPVVSKALLRSVPPFTLIAASYAVALLLSAPVLPRVLDPRALRQRGILLLLIAVVARSATNILSIRYTLAIYVQLINLLTPFAVVLLGRMVFGEGVPRRTYPALLLSTVGSGLVVLGGGAAWRWSVSDSIGVACALASTLCLALYMLLTRRVQQMHGQSSYAVLAQQMVALEAMGLAGAWLGGESWGSWLELSASTWLLFGVFVIVNVFGGNFVQIATLRYLPTNVFTSLIGVRLISALVLAWWLLDEQFTSMWQIVGAVTVLGTVTWYLRAQMVAKDVHA